MYKYLQKGGVLCLDMDGMVLVLDSVGVEAGVEVGVEVGDLVQGLVIVHGQVFHGDGGGPMVDFIPTGVHTIPIFMQTHM